MDIRVNRGVVKTGLGHGVIVGERDRLILIRLFGFTEIMAVTEDVIERVPPATARVQESQED